MASVGQLDRLVETLVNRGLVAPKFVGRQVGQAAIDELHSLSQNLATSGATRENERINRLSQFKSQVSKGAAEVSNQVSQANIGRSSANTSNAPSVVGVNKSSFGLPSTALISTPLGQGKTRLSELTLTQAGGSGGQTVNTLQDLRSKFGLEVPSDVPELATNYRVGSSNLIKNLSEIPLLLAQAGVSQNISSAN